MNVCTAKGLLSVEMPSSGGWKEDLVINSSLCWVTSAGFLDIYNTDVILRHLAHRGNITCKKHHHSFLIFRQRDRDIFELKVTAFTSGQNYPSIFLSHSCVNPMRARAIFAQVIQDMCSTRGIFQSGGKGTLTTCGNINHLDIRTTAPAVSAFPENASLFQARSPRL